MNAPAALAVEGGMDAPGTITLTLDGKQHQVPAGTTLSRLVEQLGFAPNAVGTAVNGRFVARSRREHAALHPGDSILLFQPIAGG